jgi:hypothetical protein
MFDAEFYEHLFRLRGLEFPKDTVKRPQYFGHLTNDIIYARLAPGILDELRKISEPRDNGRLKYPCTRRLTEDVGHPSAPRASGVGYHHHEIERGLRYGFHGEAKSHPSTVGRNAAVAV